MSNDQAPGRETNAARNDSQAVGAKPDKTSAPSCPDSAEGKVGPNGKVPQPAPAQRQAP